MKPNERRREIMDLLFRSSSIHLNQLVDLLQVSEGTVRNDLRLLEKKGELIRTHGGAVLGSRPVPHTSNQHLVTNTAESNQRAIAQIARRASALVDEGDSVILMGSPITREMAHDLLSMKSLTVLTNSIEIATVLGRSPSHTVILIGGQMRAERDTLDGQPAVAMLREFRVQKAFLSCDGISESRGLADDDIASGQLKEAAVACAQKVIVVASAEKLGRSGLISFATIKQVHHLVTTDAAPADALLVFRDAGMQISLCGEHITEIYAEPQPGRRWRIGFANLTERQEFAVAVRQSIERAAGETGCIDLLLVDNEANPDTALANGRRLIDAKVDLVIEYQQDEHTNNILMDLFRAQQIPVVAIDIPLSGATFFGADNYRAGRLAGDAAARWIREHWAGRLDKVVCLEQPESGPVPAARIQGQIDGLRSAIALTSENIMHVSTRGDLEGSQLAATHALRSIPMGKYALFVGINANSALGALAAAEMLDRQSYTAVISQNASGRVRRELHRRNPMLIGAVDYFPQNYGSKAIKLALEILQGRPTPPALYTDHMLITPQNVAQVYPHDPQDTAGTMQHSAVSATSTAAPTS